MANSAQRPGPTDYIEINSDGDEKPVVEALVDVTEAAGASTEHLTDNIQPIVDHQTARASSLGECSRPCNAEQKSCILQQYFRTHTEKRQFPCTVCEKKFARPYNLRMHSRIHTRETPYSCHWCVARFARSDNPYRHIQRHEKHFKCENGSACFDSKPKSANMSHPWVTTQKSYCFRCMHETLEKNKNKQINSNKELVFSARHHLTMFLCIPHRSSYRPPDGVSVIKFG